MCCYNFHLFFWWSNKIPQQNFNEPEMVTGDSVRLYCSYSSTDNFVSTNSCFWLVKILLRKFNTWSKKKKKENDKKTNFMMRNIRKCEWKHKIAFFKLSWPHWPVMQHIYNSREMEKIEMIWNCRCCQQVISPRIMHFLLDFVQYLLFEYEQSRVRMWVDRLF